jgi:hypothetical protein
VVGVAVEDVMEVVDVVVGCIVMVVVLFVNVGPFNGGFGGMEEEESDEEEEEDDPMIVVYLLVVV